MGLFKWALKSEKTLRAVILTSLFWLVFNLVLLSVIHNNANSGNNVEIGEKGGLEKDVHGGNEAVTEKVLVDEEKIQSDAAGSQSPSKPKAREKVTSD